MPQRVRNSGTARTGAFKRRPVRPRAIMERFLLLPLEEEGRLNDMPLRENFRAGVCRAVPPQANCTIAWTRMLDEEPTVPPSGRPRRRREAPGGLVPVPAVRAGKFHTAHKLTLMAHSPS